MGLVAFTLIQHLIIKWQKRGSPTSFLLFQFNNCFVATDIANL